MKIQHLAVIFVIIILPITLVVGEYIQAQIDTISMQTQYIGRLQGATYDAITAFQINTINNKYSSISDSKIRDIEASVTAFYNSLSTSMGASGYDSDELKEFVPAMLYTMYDGYYIYGKYYNYEQNGSAGQYQFGLKPYIYYACRYKYGANDFVVNYTLDNSITVYGNINGNYVTKSGYTINPNLVTNVVTDSHGYSSLKYDGIDITREILTEQLVTIESNGRATRNTYEYVKYENQKIYKYNNENRYFTCYNNRRQDLSDEGKVLRDDEITPLRYVQNLTINGHLYSESAVRYYAEAKEFSTWLSNNLGNITQNNAIDSNGNTITDFATNVGNSHIFQFGTNNNPLVEGSSFNEHRMSVIRKSIETNLASAIANYNAGSSGTYEFQMPKLNEEDWDKLLNNVSLSVFMQGLPIKSKIFNSYCIVTNDKNEEVVTEDAIYILAENANGNIEMHLPGCTDLIDNNYRVIGAYNIIDFHLQTATIGEENERYYYPQFATRCYNCIVNASQHYDIDGIIEGKLTQYDLKTNTTKTVNKDITNLRRAYLTALGRERYDLYRTNGNI